MLYISTSVSPSNVTIIQLTLGWLMFKTLEDLVALFACIFTSINKPYLICLFDLPAIACEDDSITFSASVKDRFLSTFTCCTVFLNFHLGHSHKYEKWSHLQLKHFLTTLSAVIEHQYRFILIQVQMLSQIY